MGIVQQFDPQRGLCFVVWNGVITPEVWYPKISGLVSSPQWSRTSRILGDVQSAYETTSIEEPEIRHAVQILTRDAASLKGKRLAVVARNAFGKARIFCDLIAPFGLQAVVFNTVDTACLFLGLDVGGTSQILNELRRQNEVE